MIDNDDNDRLVLQIYHYRQSVNSFYKADFGEKRTQTCKRFYLLLQCFLFFIIKIFYFASDIHCIPIPVSKIFSIITILYDFLNIEQ